jgi:hypothetical protein
MDGHIDITPQKRVFNFFGKKTFAFNFIKAQVLDLISGRFDDDQF